jgi:hypothetical protein
MIPENERLSDEQVLDLRCRYTILYETMLLVREYPDFDGDTMLGAAMDAALRGEVPEPLAFVLSVRETYGPPEQST